MPSLFLELCHDVTEDMKDTAANFLDTGINNLSQEGVMHKKNQNLVFFHTKVFFCFFPYKGGFPHPGEWIGN